MKKVAIIACVLVIGASAAFAATIVVPLFVEAPSANIQAFIGIANLDNSADVWTISYTQQDPSGNFVADAGTTFSMDALQGLTFTPISVNNPLEGPGSKVPDMTPNTGPSGNPNVAGAATISTNNAASGRYQQINGTGSATFSYGTLVDTN